MSSTTRIFTVICNYNAGMHLQNCLESISKNAMPDVRVSIFDNASIDGNINAIGKFQISGLMGITVRINEVNVGKAVALNSLVSELECHLHDDDLIFSLDSDISLVSEDFFQRAIDIWKIIGDKVSCMVCRQSGNSLFRREIFYQDSPIGNFGYFAPKEGYGAGIAGGAMFIPYRHWKTVGGYDITKGADGKAALYGGHDGNLMLNLYRKTNLPVCVIRELEVFHPPEENMDYQKWKDSIHDEHRKFGRMVSTEEFFKHG